MYDDNKRHSDSGLQHYLMLQLRDSLHGVSLVAGTCRDMLALATSVTGRVRGASFSVIYLRQLSRGFAGKSELRRVKNQTSERSGSLPRSRPRTWEMGREERGGQVTARHVDPRRTRVFRIIRGQNGRPRAAADDGRRPHGGSRVNSLAPNTTTVAARLFDLENAV